MKFPLTLIISVVSTIVVHQSHAFTSSSKTFRRNVGVLEMAADGEKQMKGIEESNVPTPMKTRRGRYTADFLKRPRRPRFESPPERESGYYESQIHKLYDGHSLSYDEYYVKENPTDLIVCKCDTFFFYLKNTITL